MEYKLKKVNISSISNNKHLGISIQEHDIDRCLKTMRNYGLLTPVVIGKINKEQDLILSGQCEINAMKQMKMKETEAIFVDCKDSLEANKLALLISTLHNQPSAIAEGLLIKEMVRKDNVKQKDIAYSLGKSESWVAKRLSLVERLSSPVIDMVINKHLCSRTAEEISKLPEEVQTNFANKVASANLSKSKVEQLVMVYKNPSVAESIKTNIIENPLDTANILVKNFEKKSKKTLEDVDSRKISLIKTSINIIINTISEIEVRIYKVPIEKLMGQKNLLSSCISSSERFAKLLTALINNNFPREISINDRGSKSV